jgi:hypothetical protein
MTQTEALRLALEALEYAGPSWIESRQPAITAIKEALAQPEQPKVRTGNCLRVGVCASEGLKIQPQRTWIGLTEDEILLISADCAASHQHTDIHFARAIEAKLKAKNT